MADSIREMGDARGGSGVVIFRNAVKDDLNRNTTGNCGTVGGVATDL